jgi:hypothetical protein
MLKKIQTLFIKANYRWLTKYFSNLGVGTWSLIGACQRPSEAANLQELVAFHFHHHSSSDHVCRKTLHAALEKLNNQPACILETGSSAWGSNSSLLFDSYVTRFGGQFESVDLRIEPSITLQEKCSGKTILHCDDSVNFLEKWSKNNPSKKIDLLYLDSWDVNWLNPTPSALHGLAEFIASSPNLREGSLLLIDDTPVNPDYFVSAQSELGAFNQYRLIHGFYPGKGSLVKQLLISLGRGQELLHHYQLLWQF